MEAEGKMVLTAAAGTAEVTSMLMVTTFPTIDPEVRVKTAVVADEGVQAEARPSFIRIELKSKPFRLMLPAVRVATGARAVKAVMGALPEDQGRMEAEGVMALQEC